jgi:hypothetical protein
LGHSCETGVKKKHDSSYYSKQNSVLSQGKILAILSTSINILYSNVVDVDFMQAFWILDATVC